DPAVAVAPGGVALGRAHRVAVPRLAVDLLALVAVYRVVADQQHGAVGRQQAQNQAAEAAGQRQAGPAGGGEGAVVAGAVTRCQAAQGAQEVGDGAPAGGEGGREGQQGEAVEGGGGEGGGQWQQYVGERGR